MSFLCKTTETSEFVLASGARACSAEGSGHDGESARHRMKRCTAALLDSRALEMRVPE